ncbi:MAG: hypothetical protein IPF92_23690 [Myxococcales bacterium]|nr:hypothetical protein [Myxococcales bacterium]MBL0194841.1 hypothetical protein [Myxococcales bacterium]HQY63691.1 tetratricopeptide repeat protein [Polyangiaceae bacterium]
MVAPAFNRSLQVAVVLVSVVGAGPALAQRAGPQTTIRQAPDGSVSAGARARAKARADDCAAALPLFDEAIRVTIEPTLRRDRGACHDKLGHAAAAIEDYRAYLYARPEGADAKTVEERIQVLSGQVDGGGKRDDDKGGGATASLSINGEGASAKAGGGSDGDKGEGKADDSSYDDYAARVKKRDQADSSSVRTGTGGAFGFYVSLRGFPKSSLPSTVGYNVGVSPRYALTSNLTLVGELGFAAFGTKAREAIGGVALWVGAELRVKLDSYGTNAILLGLGPGYERYAALDRASSTLFNTGHIRGRIGFRHVFGANMALDLSFDPSAVFFDPGPQTASIDAQLLLGGTAAFVVGF